MIGSFGATFGQHSIGFVRPEPTVSLSTPVRTAAGLLRQHEGVDTVVELKLFLRRTTTVITALIHITGSVVVTGILIKSEIEFEIAAGRLLTLPGGVPLPPSQNQARSCSFDMTVGTIFWEGKILTGPDALVTVPPGGIVALFTAEELDVPDDMCATAFAINDMSSKGFLVVNPGHVDPGFKGALTVKALNVRKTALQLGSGEAVFTVIFQRLPSVTTPYPPIPARALRERKFNKTVIETAPKTFFEMMGADRDGPYPGRSEVNEMIRAHWMSRAAVFFGAILFIFGAISAYFAAFPRAPIDMSKNAPPIEAFKATAQKTIRPAPSSSSDARL